MLFDAIASILPPYTSMPSQHITQECWTTVTLEIIMIMPFNNILDHQILFEMIMDLQRIGQDHLLIDIKIY